MGSKYLCITVLICSLIAVLFILSRTDAAAPACADETKDFDCVSTYISQELKLCGYKSGASDPFWISCHSTILADNNASAKQLPWVVVAGVISPQATNTTVPECNETIAYYIANTVGALPLRIRFDEEYEKEIENYLLKQKSRDAVKPAFGLKASSNTYYCTKEFREWLDKVATLISQSSPPRNDVIGYRLRKHRLGMMLFMQRNETNGWVAIDPPSSCPFYCHDFSESFPQSVPENLNDCEYLAIGERGVVVCNSDSITVKTSTGSLLSVSKNDCFQYFQNENKFLSVNTSFPNADDSAFIEALCKGLAENDLWKPTFRQDPMIYVQLKGKKTP